MFNLSDLKDELQALKDDVSRLFTSTGDEIFDASKHRPRLADQIKACPKEPAATARSWASPSTAIKQRAISR